MAVQGSEIAQRRVQVWALTQAGSETEGKKEKKRCSGMKKLFCQKLLADKLFDRLYQVEDMRRSERQVMYK